MPVNFAMGKFPHVDFHVGTCALVFLGDITRHEAMFRRERISRRSIYLPASISPVQTQDLLLTTTHSSLNGLSQRSQGLPILIRISLI